MHSKFSTHFNDTEHRIELLEKAGQAYLYSDSFAYKYCKICYKAQRCYPVEDIEDIGDANSSKTLITLNVSSCSSCKLDHRTTYLKCSFPPSGVRTRKSFPIYTLWED